MAREKIVHIKVISENNETYIFVGCDVNTVESLIDFNVKKVGLAIKSRKQIDSDQAAGLFKDRQLEIYLATVQSLPEFTDHARRLSIDK